MIGIIAVGTAVRDVFAKRTAQARAPPAVEIVLLSYILRDNAQCALCLDVFTIQHIFVPACSVGGKTSFSGKP